MDIQRYENLIFYANGCETTREKIEVLSQYFLNNVKVDYIRLEAKRLISNLDIANMERSQNLEFSSEEGRTTVLSKLKEKQEISPEFEQLLKQGIGKPYTITVYKPFNLGEKTEVDHYETRFTNFTDAAQEIDRGPSTYCNGLITSGNCDTFSPFVVGVMQDLGIANYSIYGKGEMDHEWIIYKDEESGEWKHCDMTYLLYARDGKKLAGECNPIEWAQAPTDRMFEMQPKRTITTINNITLPIPVTRENQPLFMGEFLDVTENRIK